MHDECMWLARFGVPEASRAAAIEATAWFELSGATAEESDAALRSTNTRLSARALAAWLAAPGAWHPDRDELRRLATLPETEPLRLQQAMPFGLHDRPTEFRCLLSEPVRTLAALALAATDVPLPQPAELAPLLQRYCGTTPDGLAAFVRERRQAGTLVAVLDTIEADCRARLGLGAELRWPSAGARR